MAAIDEVAERHNLVVVEDAAHAPGASLNGRMCGTLGGFFSFFANKNLPVGEGGLMVTDDDELAARLRLLRSHGMMTLTWDRHRGHASTYDVVLPGGQAICSECGCSCVSPGSRPLGHSAGP